MKKGSFQIWGHLQTANLCKDLGEILLKIVFWRSCKPKINQSFRCKRKVKERIFFKIVFFKYCSGDEVVNVHETFILYRLHYNTLLVENWYCFTRFLESFTEKWQIMRKMVPKLYKIFTKFNLITINTINWHVLNSTFFFGICEKF